MLRLALVHVMSRRRRGSGTRGIGAFQPAELKLDQRITGGSGALAHAAVCPTFGGCDIDAPVKDVEHLRNPSLHLSD